MKKKNINIIIMAVALCCGEYMFAFGIDQDPMEVATRRREKIIQELEKEKQKLEAAKQAISMLEAELNREEETIPILRRKLKSSEAWERKISKTRR